jgi:hypothetical protein
MGLPRGKKKVKAGEKGEGWREEKMRGRNTGGRGQTGTKAKWGVDEGNRKWGKLGHLFDHFGSLF